MYQRIVVPLDGSEPAARALVHAAELARFSGAPLHLVRIVDRVQIPDLLVPVGGGEAIAVGVWHGRKSAMRYGAETSLAPAEVLTRARSFFGAGGELGLPEAPGPAGTVGFAGPDGGVSVSALATDGKTEVTILSREYDYWAERFVRELQ